MKSLVMCLALMGFGYWITHTESALAAKSARERQQLEIKAGQGDARAQCDLGIIYEIGRGVPRNYEKAAEWYQKASDQGNALAQFKLGGLCLSGRGVPPDEAKGFELYQKAAVNRMYERDPGDAYAKLELGRRYEHGKGVPQDDAKAFEWYEKAAVQGVRDALFAVGIMYAKGKGVRQDNVRAYVFYTRAASSSSPKEYFDGFRDEMEKKLTSEQKAEAEKLSVELDKKIGWSYPPRHSP